MKITVRHLGFVCFAFILQFNFINAADDTDVQNLIALVQQQGAAIQKLQEEQRNQEATNIDLKSRLTAVENAGLEQLGQIIKLNTTGKD